MLLWGTPSSISNIYAFTYDGNNRLKDADFQAVGNALDVTYEYDKNGNLTLFERYDYFGNYIDRLDIQYAGNRLYVMTDYAGDVAGVTNYPGSTTIVHGYGYDGNGNLIREPNKELYVDYNLLNLPQEITYWGGNKKIHYFYTFDGEKLRKTVEDNGTVTKTDYCGPFVYETVSGTRSLKYFVTPEGRVVKSGSSRDYEYNLKDHLGNVRAVIRKGSNSLAELIQQKHYYPFGMEMSQLNLGTGTNKYLYNGKELQDDFELDWYDYGARFYDPELARWHSIDPMAESYTNLSPYNYGGNNPILNIDVDGEYFITYSSKIGNNYVANVTNHRWVNRMSRLSAIPYIGLAFEASLWAARGQDPSFKSNAGDYAGLGITAIGAGSLKVAMKFGKVEGLGRSLLEANREMLNSSLSLMNSPSTEEIAIDHLAVKSLEKDGIGKFYEDKTGKEMTSKFYFDKKYIKGVEKEIMANEELTSKEGFSLKDEVQNRLNQVMEDRKAEIKSLFEDE